MLPRIPAIVAELVASERLTMCLFEDSQRRRPVLMGGFGFLRRTFIERAMKVDGQSVLEQAFEAEARSRPTFLGRRQIALGNRGRNLEMVNFLASPPESRDDSLHLVSAIYDAWQFFVKGFELNGVWQENASPRHEATLVAAGYRVVRKFVRPNRAVVTLLHASRMDEESQAGSLIDSVMTCPPPVFGFSRAEQRLLECVLLDQTDPEAASILNVTPDAIKKRWRSIHAKVLAHEPAIFGASSSAVGRRRAILGRVRPRLEELRPY